MVNIDIENIRSLDYNILENNQNKKVLYLEKNDKYYIINYETDLYVNNIKFQTNKNSVDVLHELSQYDCNFLIYCHPYSYDTHWQIKYFEFIVKTLGFKNVNYTTLDVVKGGDILVDDGFDGDFIEFNSKYPIYDIVILPDCGGTWGSAWGSFEKYQKLIFEIINNVLTIIKEGGKLYLSKMSDNDFNFIYNEYRQKYKCEIDEYDELHLKYLVITKSQNTPKNELDKNIIKLTELINKHFSKLNNIKSILESKLVTSV
jgi:hypothetical protein